VQSSTPHTATRATSAATARAPHAEIAVTVAVDAPRRPASARIDGNSSRSFGIGGIFDCVRRKRATSTRDMHGANAVESDADMSAQDAIAALVARVAAGSGNERGGSRGNGDGETTSANGEEDDGGDGEPAWMADIDARIATVEDMEVETVNGTYGMNDESDAEGARVDAPGQFDDLFDERAETIVDLDESSMKTTSIMAFLETFALGPESLNGGRVTPTMGEVLERVKARKPESLPEWTMTAAAAASAYQFAVSKKRAADRAVAYAKEMRKKHSKVQAKADALASQLHVMQYGKTPDGKPVKPGQLKNPPHQTRPRGKMPPPPPEHISRLWRTSLEDYDVCHVCGHQAPDWWHAKDEIVFCDGCEIQVHMSCYGIKNLPEGDWYCTGCKEGVTKGPLVSCGTPRGICALCPHPGGALVRVVPASKFETPWLSPGHHAHLACALHLPEVVMRHQKTGESPIVDMLLVQSKRMKLKCSVCEEIGACTQCAMHKCYNAFHPLCARADKQIMLRQAASGQPMVFCKAHSAPEFEQQRFLTCGYREDGTSDMLRNKNVFWDVKAQSHEEDAAFVDPNRSTASAQKSHPSAQEEKQKDVTLEVFPRATSAEAKRIATITCVRHYLDSTHKGGAPSKLLRDMQDACKHLEAEEASRLNSLSDELGEAEIKTALDHLTRLAPKIPQGKALYADLAPWKYLKSHQIDAIHWMRNLHSLGLNGLLAFETGLGKRLTSLAFIQWVRDGLREPGQHLILCPKETAHLWIADLHRWCTSLRSVTLMSEEDEKSANNVQMIKALSYDYLVVSYERMSQCEALKTTMFKSVICDDWRNEASVGALSSAVQEKVLQAGSTFLLGKADDFDGPHAVALGRVIFPGLGQSTKSLPVKWRDLIVHSTSERVVEPPVVPAPLAKFLQFEIDAKTNPVDALMHILQTMRKQAQKVLVIAEDENALNSAAEGMSMAKLEYARLDETDQPLGVALYSAARFNTMAPENNISFLLCSFHNLGRQQGLLSGVTSILQLDGEFSSKIDASGAPNLMNMWRIANRVWGLDPVKRTTYFMKVVGTNGQDIAWKRGAALNKLSANPPESLVSSLEKIPANGNVPPEFASKDAELWDAAAERKQKRAEVEDPTWWTLHEHNCVYCGGVPGQCKNIPPAFLPPEKAGLKIRCISCPRITSMGCAYIRTVPQKGWKCPQHSCLVCLKEASPNHITFRCVSCSRAFCDSCSSGASFDAIADHPVWAPSGFQLPKFYEYVRCAICVDSILAETKRARRGK
jgi:hypothetical protein